MPHSEEPFIQETWKALHRTCHSLQNRSKLYTDGVLIVAMTRLLRDLALKYDKDTFYKVQGAVALIFSIPMPDDSNDTLGEDQ